MKFNSCIRFYTGVKVPPMFTGNYNGCSNPNNGAETAKKLTNFNSCGAAVPRSMLLDNFLLKVLYANSYFGDNAIKFMIKLFHEL
jgi:hypothetical protein